jgi:hypothetical protein
MISRGVKLINDAEPEEDQIIAVDPQKHGPSSTWSRTKPKAADTTTMTALIDLVTRERAHQSHYAIELAPVTESKVKDAIR